MIPWFYHHLSNRDQEGTLLRPLNHTLPLVAAADSATGEYTVPDEKYLVLTNWAVQALFAAGAPTAVQVLIQPPDVNVPLHDGGQRMQAVVLSGQTYGLWTQSTFMLLPPRTRVAITIYANAPTGITGRGSIQGCLIPRGYLPSDSVG